MKLKITVHGVAYEVDVEVLDAQDEMQNPGSPLPRPAAPAPVAPAGGNSAAPVPVSTPGPAPAGGGVVSPIAGTVLEVKCKPGDQVSQGQALLVIEAMKMETVIAASQAGRVKSVPVAPGDAVRENQMLVEFE